MATVINSIKAFGNNPIFITHNDDIFIKIIDVNKKTSKITSYHGYSVHYINKSNYIRMTDTSNNFFTTNINTILKLSSSAPNLTTTQFKDYICFCITNFTSSSWSRNVLINYINLDHFGMTVGIHDGHQGRVVATELAIMSGAMTEEKYGAYNYLTPIGMNFILTSKGFVSMINEHYETKNIITVI